jgi:hypothetical protein
MKCEIGTIGPKASGNAAKQARPMAIRLRMGALASTVTK